MQESILSVPIPVGLNASDGNEWFHFQGNSLSRRDAFAERELYSPAEIGDRFIPTLAGNTQPKPKDNETESFHDEPSCDELNFLLRCGSKSLESKDKAVPCQSLQKLRRLLHLS